LLLLFFLNKDFGRSSERARAKNNNSEEGSGENRYNPGTENNGMQNDEDDEDHSDHTNPQKSPDFFKENYPQLWKKYLIIAGSALGALVILNEMFQSYKLFANAHEGKRISFDKYATMHNESFFN